MFRVLLVLSVGLVSLAQADEFIERAHPRPPKLYRLNPANIPEKAVAASKSLVRDHRYDPVRVYTVYTASVRPTAEAGREAALLIRYSNGQEYDGRDAYGTIRSVGLGLCLTNPATYTGGADSGVLRWEACQASGAGLPYRRQLFLIAKNSHNLIKVQSDLQYVMQVPNAKSECLTQVTPTEVKRLACNNLHNWMLTR